MKSKKKILFIVPSLGMGGMERVLVNYANLFVNRNYDVTVYNLTSGDKAITQHFNKNIHYYESYSPVKNVYHASIGNVLQGKFRLISWKKWIDKKSAEYLHEQYVQEHFDIEVAFFGMESIKIVSGCRDTSVLTLAWIHGEQKENDYAPLSKYEEAVGCLNKIDKVICVSKRAMDTVPQIYQRTNNLFVVNNPNDTKKIRELSQEENVPIKRKFTFINASRFDDKQKGYTRMLKVCKRLVDEGYDFDFWLVGDGIDYEKIADVVKQNQLDNIMLLGKQSNPYKYIKNADMYVCFSYSEGFSMVMMETVILATPMISTDVPGAGEMLDNGKYGMIVENSEEGLYNGLKKILSDKDLYCHYQKMAEIRKDYLREEKIMDYIESIIKGVEKCQN